MGSSLRGRDVGVTGSEDRAPLRTWREARKGVEGVLGIVQVRGVT
jgi:hypothetical protein